MVHTEAGEASFLNIFIGEMDISGPPSFQVDTFRSSKRIHYIEENPNPSHGLLASKYRKL